VRKLQGEGRENKESLPFFITRGRKPTTLLSKEGGASPVKKEQKIQETFRQHKEKRRTKGAAQPISKRSRPMASPIQKGATLKMPNTLGGEPLSLTAKRLVPARKRKEKGVKVAGKGGGKCDEILKRGGAEHYRQLSRCTKGKLRLGGGEGDREASQYTEEEKGDFAKTPQVEREEMMNLTNLGGRGYRTL